MDKLLQTVTHFLRNHLDPQKPFLLALSGGPDSLALFYILLAIRKQTPFQLGIAHVNHNWRKESGAEADQLEKLADKHQLPFYLLELNPLQFYGNLESYCRKQRLSFFKAIADRHGYQAVMQAHHQDDQAETILKRLFEGGQLCGMRPLYEIDGIPIWRPLLSVTKSALINWLDERKLSYFDDPSNEDPRFLRGRFRKRVLPFLHKEFGRSVSKALCKLANQSQEVEELLDTLIAPYLAALHSSPTGLFLDLSKNQVHHPLIIRHLIRRLAERSAIQLSREQLERGAELLLMGAADRQISTHDSFLYFDRKRLFIETRLFPSIEGQLFLQQGRFSYGPWQVEVREASPHETAPPNNWYDAWRGELTAILPKGSYQLAPPEMNQPYPRTSSLGKWWNSHKIPAFLRPKTPVIWQEGRIIWEFLTGKEQRAKSEDAPLSMRISLFR